MHIGLSKIHSDNCYLPVSLRNNVLHLLKNCFIVPNVVFIHFFRVYIKIKRSFGVSVLIHTIHAKRQLTTI